MKNNIIVYGLRKSLVDKLKNNFDISVWIQPNKDDLLGIELLNQNPSVAQDIIDFKDTISLPEYLYHEIYSKYVTSISRQFSFVDGMEPLEPFFAYHFAIISSLLLKNNPEIILFANYPHEGIDVILSCLSKFLNIKTIYLSQSLFDSSFYASKSEDYNHLIYSRSPLRSLENKNINLFYMNSNKKVIFSNLIKFIQQIPQLRTTI